MKLIPVLMLVMALSLSAKEEKSPNPAWMKLSVCVQNVAWEFRLLPDEGAPDPDSFEDSLKKINEALDELVKDGELVERKVDLLPPEDLDDEGFEFLMDYAGKLSEAYGHYTALELMDIGLEKRLSVLKPGEPFVLRLRLPAEQLNDLLEKLDEKELLMRVNEDK